MLSGKVIKICKQHPLYTLVLLILVLVSAALNSQTVTVKRPHYIALMRP